MAALLLFLALLLAISAMHKLAARERLSVSAARLAGLPAALGPALLLAAATIEGLAAAALLTPSLHRAGAIAAAGLWGLYAAALAARRGAVLDCGCDLVRRERPVGPFAIARAALLAAAALLVAVLPPAALTIEAPFAALALLALYAAAAELAALPFTLRPTQRRPS